ncbi:MAG TPA: hypothetical protein VGL00_17615 [Terracidiphilus sp.]
MTSPSTQIESGLRSGAACEVLPVPPDRQLPSHLQPPDRQLPAGRRPDGSSIQGLIQTYTGLALEALEFARISGLRTWDRARRGTVKNASRAARGTRQIVTRTQNQARNLQRTHPVRVLGIVAATAFLAGVASRLWRSSAHES